MKSIISSFDNLSSAAFMYLEESFDNLNLALENEAINILVYSSISYSDEDDEMEKILEETLSKPIDYLRSGLDSLSNLTFDKIKRKRAEVIISKKNLKYSFANDSTIYDRKVMLHITHLAFFVEVLTNRHIFFLKETSSLSGIEYNHLEKSSVLNKIVYITKNEKISLNHISKLFTLRNKAVHYTPSNSQQFNVTIELLKAIWNQIVVLLKKFEEKEEFREELNSEMLITFIEEYNELWN